MLAPPPEAIAAATQGDGAARPDQPKVTPPANLNAFLDRNLFKAAREDLAAARAAELAAEQEKQDDGTVDVDNCERSQMAAGLIATMVLSRETDSVAVFEDRGKKEPVVLRLGERLLDEAELISIDTRRVLVKHNGRCELFSLEEEGAATTVASTAPAPVETPAEAVASAGEGDLGKNVKKVSESEYEIPKSDIEGVLGNLNQVATQARIVPSFNNGKANGFKLFSIRPGSLYSKIGIQNGDIVQRINGYEMNSPDKALEIYSKLKDAQSITVDLIRRGKSQTMTYQIR
ncbi:general secretion pathway protein GspC [Myxococcota bacterium]|nr:general secretion pathway protein GspC [Myxococcota bacterium]